MSFIKSVFLLQAVSLVCLFGASWEDLEYQEDMEVHRAKFIEWVNRRGLSGIYDRVVLTVSCTDSDYIPKHPDAGKVFMDGPEPYQMMHNGVKVVLDGYCGEWMTDVIYGLKGHHEPQEEKAFYEVLKQIPSKAVMIELGSYWGYYSLWFASQIEEPTNYLIEPDLTSLKIGQRNFALNNRDGVFINGYAGSFVSDAANFQEAKQIHIDNFLEENGIDHVHILHSDIQGHEYDMLHTARESMRMGKIDYFFISTHSEPGHQRCLQFLKEHRYRILAKHKVGESYSADGLIVACRRGLWESPKIKVSHRLENQE